MKDITANTKLWRIVDKQLHYAKQANFRIWTMSSTEQASAAFPLFINECKIPAPDLTPEEMDELLDQGPMVTQDQVYKDGSQVVDMASPSPQRVVYSTPKIKKGESN